jgi:uncharacterized protein YjiS (DUF1127 family)
MAMAKAVGQLLPSARRQDRENVMTALSLDAASRTLSQAATALAETAARSLRRAVAAWRHRNDAAVLAGLDDRMLADIGVTRADLRDAIAGPLWSDPTALLARRRRERRAARGFATVELGRHCPSPPLAPGAEGFADRPRQPPARLAL